MPSWIIQLQLPFCNYFLVASASQRSDRTRATVRYASEADIPPDFRYRPVADSAFNEGGIRYE